MSNFSYPRVAIKKKLSSLSSVRKLILLKKVFWNIFLQKKNKAASLQYRSIKAKMVMRFYNFTHVMNKAKLEKS